MALIMSPTSNQITSGSSVFGSGTGSYDASGNTTQILGNTASYNGAGRMSSANFNGATAQFIYNALGERIYKNASGSGVTLFMYDEGHHLIGEYGNSGNLIEETVWMDDTPVATLRPSGSGIAIYYVHTDHLNTPRKVSVPGSNAVVWRTDLDPFEVFPADNVPGDGVNQNPSGLGNFVFNLGFPGQYLDQETSIGYNFHRDYAAALGRYLESDPIGLDSGINTYAYADNDPLDTFDPLGLYRVLPGIPAPSPEIDALLNCIESRTGLRLTVTSTSTISKVHAAGTPHARGVAVDLRYPTNPSDAGKILCAAGACGAEFALDEAQHPSAHATGPHIHIQIPRGKGGGRGDLPSKTCGNGNCDP